MPTERRTVADIRGEIASERAQLELALADLRHDVDAKRKPAAAVAGTLVAGLVALLGLRIARRVRNR